jgi:hypothetical protein
MSLCRKNGRISMKTDSEKLSEIKGYLDEWIETESATTESTVELVGKIGDVFYPDYRRKNK